MSRQKFAAWACRFASEFCAGAPKWKVGCVLLTAIALLVALEFLPPPPYQSPL